MVEALSTSLSSNGVKQMALEKKVNSKASSLLEDSLTMNNGSKEENKQAKREDLVCLAKAIYGIVKWYNVKFQYGFISRIDTKEDIFVHKVLIKVEILNFKNGIKRSNPKKIKSVADGEVVQFDIYQAEKGPEARNVTGPEGRPARASRFARFRVRRFNNYKTNGRFVRAPRIRTEKIIPQEKNISNEEKTSEEVNKKTLSISQTASNEQSEPTTSGIKVSDSSHRSKENATEKKQKQKKKKSGRKIIYIIKEKSGNTHKSSQERIEEIVDAAYGSMKTPKCEHAAN